MKPHQVKDAAERRALATRRQIARGAAVAAKLVEAPVDDAAVVRAIGVEVERGKE